MTGIQKNKLKGKGIWRVSQKSKSKNRIANLPDFELKQLRNEDDLMCLGNEVYWTLELNQDFQSVPNNEQEPFKQEFDILIKEWVSAIKYKSLESQQVNHLAFLRIIAIGDKVLPSIFEEFSKRPFMAWLKALPAIIGQDVASEAESFPEAVRLWIGWGKENDYLPK